jgi:hypothetical protein
MKKKILIWMDRDLKYFSMSSFLKNITECDLFAIYETHDKPKEFFKKQNIVEFEREWYFHDEVKYSNKKPDLDYLSMFEKKYGIKLWMIAYSERLYLKWNKYHKFTYNEILSMFEQECRFFEKILEQTNPDFVIMRLTDFHHINLFYQICKNKKIKVLMSFRIRFGNKWIISSDSLKIEENLLEDDKNKSNVKEFQNMIERKDSFKLAKKTGKMGIGKNIFLRTNSLKSILNLFFAHEENNDRNRFLDQGKTRFKIILKGITPIIKSHFRSEFINKKFLKEINEHEKFIYFSLHVEPERSILEAAPFYTNQLEVIRHISKSIPIDYKLYVKEHPAMKKFLWRPISFYKQILELPNIELLHPNIEPDKILKKCDIVITISGTTGLEAAFYNKQAILFSDVIYSELDSIHKIKNLEELPGLIRNIINSKLNLNKLDLFISKLGKYSFTLDINALNDDTHPFHNTILSNIRINPEKMKVHLKKHEEDYRNLALEYIKRINFYDEEKLKPKF